MTHEERVEAALAKMLAEESPADPPERVDIVASGEGDEVAFTGIWLTAA